MEQIKEFQFMQPNPAPMDHIKGTLFKELEELKELKEVKQLEELKEPKETKERRMDCIV